MKNLPGVRTVGFLSLVLMVSAGVCRWAQGDPTPTPSPTPNPTPGHGLFIVRLGWHPANIADLDTLDITLDQLNTALTTNITETVQPSRYKFQKWSSGHAVNGPESPGNLQPCAEPHALTSAASAGATSSPASTAAPLHMTTTSGAKTQYTATVAFSNPTDASQFLTSVNAALTSTSKPTPSPTP